MEMKRIRFKLVSGIATVISMPLLLAAPAQAQDSADQSVSRGQEDIVVTARNGKGTLARIAANLARSEADITHVDMDEQTAMDTIDLRFSIAVHDLQHLETALRDLRRTADVLRAVRAMPQQ